MLHGDKLLDELKARGFFKQCTDEAALAQHLSEPRRVYVGFDPTADSLTIGNLVPIMGLRTFRRYGHTPVVVLGGATGRIGDPSGKDAERSLMSDEQVERNIAAQRSIFRALLGDDVELIDNDSWFRSMSAYTFLRDVGKHFSVNQMIARDAVRNRLEREGHGISFTEFSYMLLQAYDFLHLFQHHRVSLQFAGADQWGNVVSGVDLIRRLQGHADSGTPRAFGLTAPLVTRADGGKFGKTESGAIWLSHKRPGGALGTSPYAYYQFWLNVSDADVERYLHLFTDLPLSTVAEVMAGHQSAPHERRAQRTLAQAATTLLHGPAALEQAEAAATALFSGDVQGLDRETLEDAFGHVPSSEHARAELAGDGLLLVDVLAQSSLVKSKSEARKQIEGGAVSINGARVEDVQARLTTSHLLHDSVILLRRGKKAWHVSRWR